MEIFAVVGFLIKRGLCLHPRPFRQSAWKRGRETQGEYAAGGVVEGGRGGLGATGLVSNF